MKRLLIFVIRLFMVFLITACSKSEIAGSSPEGGTGREETAQTEQP